MPFLGGRASASRGFFGGGSTPTPPTNLSSIEGNQQLTISFTAPLSNGGLTIGNYEYALSTNGGSSYGAWTALSPVDTSSPIVIGGLTNGQAYHIKLRARNALGGGQESDPLSTNTTPFTLPSAPTVTTVTPGNSQVYIEYQAPNNGGRAITEYLIRHSTNNGATWSSPISSGNDLNHTITGLTNGTSYIFQVAAQSSAGIGNYSASSSAVTPRTVPSKMATPTSSAGDRTFSISWSAVVFPENGGSAVTGYTAEYSSDGGTTWVGTDTLTSTSKSWTVLNGVSYIGRVRANNVAGDGAYSDASTARTPTFAAPSVNVAAVSGYPNVNNSNTWNQRRFTITFSPTACSNYKDTYVYVQRVTDATGATNFSGASESSNGPYTSTAGQTLTISTHTLNGVSTNVNYGQFYKVTVTTRNNDTPNHSVSSSTVYSTGSSVTHYTESAVTTAPRTNTITVTGNAMARQFFNWSALSTQRVVSVKIRAKIDGAYDTVSTTRNPIIRYTGASLTETHVAESLYNFSALRAIGGTTREATWDHVDLNTNYDFQDGRQRYSIEGGGSLGTWQDNQRISVNLDVNYISRVTNII